MPLVHAERCCDNVSVQAARTERQCLSYDIVECYRDVKHVEDWKFIVNGKNMGD